MGVRVAILSLNGQYAVNGRDRNNTFYMQICVQILTVRLCLSALLEHGRVDIYIQPVDVKIKNKIC